MSTLPEARGVQSGVVDDLGEAEPRRLAPVREALPRARPFRARVAPAVRDGFAAVRFPLTVYALSRLLYLVIAVADTFIFRHVSFLSELQQWDGAWYARMAAGGYPSHVVSNEWSTLGFFPLYTILMWTMGQVTGLPYLYSGFIVALVTGALATVLVAKLAEHWFGTASSRRAIVFFCLFPGSIVFSMDYTEGLLLTLIAGSMLAVQHRRWLLAGVLAGLATAVGPVAFAIMPALVVAAVLEIRRRGATDRRAWRALAAPALAPAGAVAFGSYLWVHTGSPFASYIAQRDAWHEHSSPLALFSQAEQLVDEIFGPHTWRHPNINLNYIAGLLGAVFMVWALPYLWRARDRVSPVAIVWTLGVAFLTVTSDQVPPNPRMLICAFPLLIALAAQLGRTGYRRLIVWSTGALVLMSALTFYASALRP
jgi:hypothetical protein